MPGARPARTLEQVGPGPGSGVWAGPSTMSVPVNPLPATPSGPLAACLLPASVASAAGIWVIMASIWQAAGGELAQ